MKHEFGGPWTVLKLDCVKKYLGAYTTALKNTSFELCYIDAFAGNGGVNIKDSEIPGSAKLAISYDFDYYYFIEQKGKFCEDLEKIKINNPQKNIIIINEDANEWLPKLKVNNRLLRGVIFLDPYSLEVSWETLSNIANHKVFDVWYLFPIGALNRLLKKDGELNDRSIELIQSLLGDLDWKESFYEENPQLSFFEKNKRKITTEKVKSVVIKRLENIFPYVSPNPLILKNSNNAPMFLLCFAVSNPSQKAFKLASKIADNILSSTK